MVARRTVLAVVHNVTAATRLLDIVPLWAADPRVQTVFSCIGSSAFTAGTTEFLAHHGMATVPWRDAVAGHADLAVSASYGGPLHELTAPLVVVPHGMGYNKYLGDGNETGRAPVFGLSAPWLLRGDRVIPSIAVLSHAEQRDRLRSYCPDAVGATLVAGDPCFDRLLASRPLRETYRAALGIRPEQRLVMISSTWGRKSLFGSDPFLIASLARRLPLDEYRIVVALHPNIWQHHSSWQVRMWLADCARAGVTVLPPEEGWRAALVAADVTIGDHGSVAFYSAALGTPLLLDAWPEDEVDPASPIGALLTVAPRLDVSRDPAEQIEHTISTHSPTLYSPITALTTSAPGEAARLLRAAVYRELGLDEPGTPCEPTAVPVPESAPEPVRSQLVDLELETGGDSLVASGRRFPAEALDHVRRLGLRAPVFVTSTLEPSRRWLELAEVLVHDSQCADPRHWIRSSLAALPGCLLAAMRENPGSWLVGDADGSIIRFTGDDDLGPVFPVVIHAWLRAGRKLSELPARCELRLGRRSARAEIGFARPGR